MSPALPASRPVLACEAFGGDFQRDDAPHLLDGDTLREMSFGVKAQDLSYGVCILRTPAPSVVYLCPLPLDKTVAIIKH